MGREHQLSSIFFCRWPQEIVLHGEERRRGAGGDADLTVDMLDVVGDGTLRDLQAARHLAVGQPRLVSLGTSTSRVLNPAGHSRRRGRLPVLPRTASAATPSSRPYLAVRRG
jgi:hypothetical protein